MNKYLRGFFGFIVCAALLISVVVAGVFVGFGAPMLKSKKLSDFLKNSGSYDTIHEAAVVLVVDTMDIPYVDKELVREIIPKDLITDLSDRVLDAFEDEKPIDLSDMETESVDYVANVADKTTDGIFDALEEASIRITPDTIKNLDEVKDFEESFNVKVTDDLVDLIFESGKLTEIKASDLENIRGDATSIVHDEVRSICSDVYKNYIHEVENQINKAINGTHSNEISQVIKLYENVQASVKVVLVVTIVLSLVLIGVIILMYKKEIYRAFRNLAIIAVLSSITQLVLGFIISIAVLAIEKEIESNEPEVLTAYKAFTSNTIDAISTRFFVFGLVLFAAFIGCVITSVRTKKSYKLRISAQ